MMCDMLGAALNVFRSGFIWRDAELEEAAARRRVALGRAVRPTATACSPRSKRSRAALVVENKDGKWRTQITFEI